MTICQERLQGQDCSKTQVCSLRLNLCFSQLARNDVHQGYTGSARMVHPCWWPAEMADVVEVQEAVVEQQNRKRMKDELRSLLEQRKALEDAALFEPNLDSLVRAGYVTAETIKDSGRQVLEALGLPLAQITKLGRAFGSHGELTAKSGQVLSLIDAAKVLSAKSLISHVRHRSFESMQALWCTTVMLGPCRNGGSEASDGAATHETKDRRLAISLGTAHGARGGCTI